MGTGDEQFCLRWNDYQESFTATLQDLHAGADFVDVTLVCEGQKLSAHKLILSACSDFFRDLLRTLTRVPNPVICLWDMSVDDVRKILAFMYNGEVEVRQAHLNTFLAVAERLRVKGLCQSGGKTSPNPALNRRASLSPVPPKGATAGAANTSSSSSSKPGPSRPRSRSPAEDRRRRSSVGDEGSEEKKLKIDDSITVKEESPSSAASKEPASESGAARSAAGSEADYGEYGYPEGGFEALMGMGMPRGMMDPSMLPKGGGGGDDGGGYMGSAYPSAASGGGRPKYLFTKEQQTALESIFASEPYPSKETRYRLACELSVREAQVANWFQNRRARGKQRGEIFDFRPTS